MSITLVQKGMGVGRRAGIFAYQIQSFIVGQMSGILDMYKDIHIGKPEPMQDPPI